MSILIKGMEMPTRCCECRLSTCHSFKERPLCDVLVEYMSYGEWETKRLENCPLVEILPHGRLIDAGALIDAIIAKYIRHERHREVVFAVVQIKQDMADIINELPTIIPADKEEQE